MTDEKPEPPPPPGPQAPPAPAPGGDGGDEPWAARLGLVRPRHGRLVAGVCAGIGRATNTDPLLWRVLIGVLSVFGIGVFLYLGAWLLTPAEGDTASPVESLIGRGQSSTSTGLTIALGIVAVLCIGAITESWVVPVIAIVALVVVALANPRTRTGPVLPARVPGPEPVTEPIPGPVPPAAPQAGYQPPFAPHGPYATAPMPPVAPLKLPKPKRERSRLGRFVVGLALVATGVLGIADLAGVSVPMTAYVAVALLIVGIGLIVAAWFGRARSLILLGVVLSIALPIVADEENRDRSGYPERSVYWVPVTFHELGSTYEHRLGDATLDLTQLDFSGREESLQVEVSAGTLRVIVPDNVDVTIRTDVRLGNASVFGQDINGVNVGDTRTDLGEDGAGGGKLEIRLNVRAGDAVVTRENA